MVHQFFFDSVDLLICIHSALSADRPYFYLDFSAAELHGLSFFNSRTPLAAWIVSDLPPVDSLTFSGYDSDPMVLVDDRDSELRVRDNSPIDYGFLVPLWARLSALPVGVYLTFLSSFSAIFFVFYRIPTPPFSWQEFIQSHIGLPDPFKWLLRHQRRRLRRDPKAFDRFIEKHFREARRRRKIEYLRLRWISTLPPEQRLIELNREAKERNWTW